MSDVGGKEITWRTCSRFLHRQPRNRRKRKPGIGQLGIKDVMTMSDVTHHRSCTRDCNPAQGFPYLEGKNQTVDDSDDPEVDRVRERDGCGQNTLKAGQRVSEGEQRI